MVKSIIKRIIVGVGIALVLMAIKDGGLIGNVQAMEVMSSNASYYAIYYTDGTKNSGNTSTITFDYMENDFNTAPFPTVKQINYVRYSFSASSNQSLDITNTLDFHFLIYGNFKTDFTPPYNVWIQDRGTTKHVYQCQVSSSIRSNSIGQTATALYPIGYFTTVRCDNVALTSKGFFIFVGDSFTPSASNSTQAISTVSIYPHSSNQNVVNAIDENTQATQDVNNSLNDESDADTGSFLEDVNQDYSNNPVSDLITMPITFLQRLNNNINGSCITWNLGSLLGTNLTMPCINLQQILGSTLYNLIDMAICLFLAYNLGLMCVTIWNNMTSLKDDFDDMYSPRHAYNGKHTGGGS